jgi:hypothetical protein
MNRPQRERRQVDRFRANNNINNNNNNNNVLNQPAPPRQARRARREPEQQPEPEQVVQQAPPQRRRRARAQQPEGRMLDLTLTKFDYGYHNIFDPEAPFYTELGYFEDPDDDIKRRFNQLDFSKYEGEKTIKGLANYEIPDIENMDVTPVSFARFKNGDYQKGR